MDDVSLTTMLVMAAILAFRQALEMVGKKIPDDATGILGFVRKLAKTLALYIKNDEGETKNGPAN